MRVLVFALALLAVPSLATAQETDSQELTAPRVELQQTTPDPAAGPADAQTAPDRPAPVESEVVVERDAVQAGDPTTGRWWWLVGVIVAAGVIVAILLD